MPRGQRGSGFVGLQNYLGLNQQAGQRMGNELAQQVEQQGSAARGAIDTAAQDFRQRAGVGQQYGAIGSSPDAMRNVEQANRVLGGPTQFGDTSALALQAANAQRTAQMAGSGAGRQVLLAKQYGQGGNYTTGARMLDSALAGRGGGDRLQNAVGAYSKMREYLGTSQAASEAATGDARKRAQEALGQAGNYLTTAPPMGTPVPQRPPGSTEVPEYLRAPSIPQVEVNKRVEDENARKARKGWRG